MNGKTFYLAGGSKALTYAADYLSRRGANIATEPGMDVTHLLLPVPSFDNDGNLRGGGSLGHILVELGDDVVIMGGNLDHPLTEGYQTADFLRDERYLAENAAITADCAIPIAENNLPVVIPGCPILVIGWGRIGKCLASKLKAIGADVTVSARKDSDLAMLQALGYAAEKTGELGFSLMRYRVIFNTVPAQVISEAQATHCRPDCIKIDLASRLGIAGENVIWARGLPGKDAPETSGILIAKTALRYAFGKELCL